MSLPTLAAISRLDAMLDVDNVVSTMCGTMTGNVAFEPTGVNLTDYFVASAKGDEEDELPVTITDLEK